MRLTLTLGGPKLAYAISHALNLPSIRTTQARSQAPRLRVCVGFPTLKEIQYNLAAIKESSCLDAPSKGKLRLFSLLSDEISLDKRLRFCPARDRVIGLAREDTSELDLKVTLANLEAIATEMREGNVHIAEEATIVALAAYGSANYDAVPIMFSGTNKTEKDGKQRKWLKMVIGAVEHFMSESKFGILTSIASDGDATRRRALHHELTSQTLDPSDPLYELIGDLPLMNMACGKNNVTLDIDYKHKFKSSSIPHITSSTSTLC